MSERNFTAYYNATINLFFIYIFGLIVFMGFRTALLLSFGDFNELGAYRFDLLHAYWVGFRFDTTVLTFGLVIPFLLNLFVIILPIRRYELYSHLRKFTYWYLLIVFFFFLFILLSDYFYFKFFQSHLNVLMFGIMDDDTKAVLTSVWTDYPIIKIFLFITVLMYLFSRFTRNILSWKIHVRISRPVFRITSIILITGIYILAMRGSIGVFPIQLDDTTISANNFVNNLTTNGVFSFKVALQEKSMQKIDTDIPKMLRHYGFKAPEEAISQYLDIPINNSHEPDKLLLAKTDKNTFLEKNPPHVIFILMESMSNYYIDLHSRELNLFGSLEKELPYCYLFRNFLSATNGTIHTLEALMVNSPRTPLSQSSFMDRTLSTSVALPFEKIGYQTSFLTGGKLGWRNLDKFVERQHFQAVEGSAVLMSEVKDAKSWEWGIYDEFLFERIYNKIENSTGIPQFIFAMTITNHTPFDLPDTYRPYPVNLSPEIKNRLRTNENIAIKNLTSYQYANDSLGRLIERIRKSPFGKNTIIAATGDHNTLQLFDFSDSMFLQKLSVPFVLYVPEGYKPKAKVDTERFGSHKDIFPTLFSLALPDTEYLRTGNNFLGNSNRESDYFGINDYRTAMNKDGCVLIQERPLYYRWKRNMKGILEPTTLQDSPGLERLLNKAKGFTASMNYYIQRDLMRKPQ